MPPMECFRQAAFRLCLELPDDRAALQGDRSEIPIRLQSAGGAVTQAGLVAQKLRVGDISGKVLEQRQILPGGCRIAEGNCPRVPIHVTDR